MKIPAPRSFGLPDPPQPIASTRTSSRIPRLNKATCVLAADDQAAGIRRTQPLQSPRGSGLPVASPRSRFRASRTSSMRSNVLECEDDVDGTCSKGDDVAVGLSSSTTMVEDHTQDQRGRGALEEQATETDEEQAWDETRSREGEEDGVDDGQEEQRPLRPQQAQQQGWQEDDDSEGEAWHDVEDERIETSVSRTGVGVAQRISPTSHRISSKGEASKTVFELTAERIDANEEGLISTVSDIDDQFDHDEDIDDWSVDLDDSAQDESAPEEAQGSLAARLRQLRTSSNVALQGAPPGLHAVLGRGRLSSAPARRRRRRATTEHRCCEALAAIEHCYRDALLQFTLAHHSSSEPLTCESPVGMRPGEGEHGDDEGDWLGSDLDDDMDDVPTPSPRRPPPAELRLAMDAPSAEAMARHPCTTCTMMCAHQRTPTTCPSFLLLCECGCFVRTH